MKLSTFIAKNKLRKILKQHEIDQEAWKIWLATKKELQSINDLTEYKRKRIGEE
jgi:hypothetical protein